jgi:hypothetical protein
MNKSDNELLNKIKIEIKKVNLEIEAYTKYTQKVVAIDNNIVENEKFTNMLSQLEELLVLKNSKKIKNLFSIIDDLKVDEKNTKIKEILKEYITSYNFKDALKYLQKGL